MSAGRPARGLALAAIALALVVGPVAGQGAGRDTTRPRQEIIRDRLRAITPLVRRDTAQAAGDTAAQQAAVADTTRRAAQPVEGLTGVTPDSIMAELLRLTGYVSTQYRADSARFESDSSRLDLRSKAEVVREGQRLVADTAIIFSQQTNIACAYGKPTLSGQGMSAPITADSLCYNVDTQLGLARGAETTISEGANWYVRSDVSFLRGDTVYTHSGIFTDCDLEEPHYHFAAGEIKVVRGNLLVARNVTFNFRDVPVFWLPFFAQSMKQGRRSGLLTPRFGINDLFRQSTGYQRSVQDVGFFWAISDHYGFETALDWRSNDYTSLRGTLEFSYLRQFLAGNVTYRNFWKSEGGRDFTIAGNGDWRPDERTNLRADVSYATSTAFVRQRSIDPRELNRKIGSRGGLSRRFDWGSLNLQFQRDQFLTDNTVSTVFPGLGLSLSSITLFPAAPGEEAWFSNATWTANANAQMTSRSVDNANPSRFARGREERTGSVNSSFTLGKFAWTQDFQIRDVADLARTFPADTAGDSIPPLPHREERRMMWNTGINFQQRLIGSTTFTPGLSIRGEILEGDTTGGDRVAAPMRIDFNASLRTDLYGFFPGVGSIERLRHKVSPSLTYTYSPRPTITERQREVFPLGEIREQNRLTIGLSQSFEAKMKQTPRDSAQAPGDTARVPADTSRARADTAIAPPGPRRRDVVQPVTVLSIATDAVVYDFVRAREDGEGVQTGEISNNIQSDLFRGLQFSFTHDLFRELPADTAAGLRARRSFAPHLSRVSASFSLSADSWLARVLGLGRARPGEQPGDSLAGAAAGARADSAAVDTTTAPQVRRTEADFGVLGANRRREQPPRAPTGSWNATFNYTLFRPRDQEGSGGLENQMLTANISFQPTQNWAVQWNTGYNFTDGEFTDHILSLTRMMHDWDANFDFVKAQNGNFSFQFRVQLRANPDIKLDYEQRDIPGAGRTRAP